MKFVCVFLCIFVLLWEVPGNSAGMLEDIQKDGNFENFEKLIKEILTGMVAVANSMKNMASNSIPQAKSKLELPIIGKILPKITNLLTNLSIAVVKLIGGGKKSVLKSKPANVACENVDVNDNYQVRVCKRK